MSELNTIRYLKQSEIDKKKWDDCIDASDNGLIYGKTCYLDIFAKHWDGLVLGDYKMVMPLVWNRKYGFNYIYQPYFVCQLGVFGKNVDPKISDMFLDAIPKKFSYWDIDLPESNQSSAYKIKSYSRVNMLLSLKLSYEELQRVYNRLAGRMLSKAKAQDLRIREDDELENCLNFYWEEYDHILKQKDTHHQILLQAFSLARERGELISLSIYKGDVRCGIYILLKDRKNIYSVLGGGSAMGKEIGAFYALTDYVIEKFSNRQLVFRFEGSDIKGIANFNGSFGAKAVEYLHVKNNRLPFPFRLLKK